MKEDEIRDIIQSILVIHFNIPTNDQIWDKTLEGLNNDFTILGFLIDLENILKAHFQQNISLVEHIDPTFNTLKDIVILIGLSHKN